MTDSSDIAATPDVVTRGRYLADRLDGYDAEVVASLLAALETAETERDQLRKLARDTAKMFSEIEGSGELYYAPVHRMVDLLAEVAGGVS